MSEPEGDDQTDHPGPRDAPQQPVLSSREWLARSREMPVVLKPPPQPGPPFTWGVRAVISAAALFYVVVLVVRARETADQPMSLQAAALFGLAVVLAVVALVGAWRWAGRTRFSPSQIEATTADLSPEQTATVRRMVRGRGSDVVELRPWAAASAWAQWQNIGVVPAFVALGNIGTLAQSSGSIVGLVLGAVVLLITVGGLGWMLWLGHRVRVLTDALHLDVGPPPVAR